MIPALIPLAAIVTGVVFGCVILPEAPPAVLAPLMIAALAVSIAAYVRDRRAVFAAAIGGTFALAAWLLAMDALAAALRPSLLALAESRAPGLTGSSPGEGVVALEIEGTLREDAVRSENGFTLSVEVDTVIERGERRKAGGGVRLTVYGTLAARQAEDWLAGRRVRAAAQLRRPSSYLDPGVADSRLSLARRGTILIGSVKSGALVELRGQGPWAAELAARCRSFARRAIGESVGPWSDRSAAIVTAILIGDRAGLDDEIRERLQQAGTYHVIAISGGNIAILAGLSMLLLRVAGIGLRTACAGTAGALVFYAGLVGGGASVVRATLMGVAYLLARMGDHRGAALNALAVAVSIILAAAPLAVFDPALALTAGATLGILVGSTRLSHHLPATGWLRTPATLGLASLSAELALFPVAAFVFSRVTFAGLALNFAAIPLMTIAQVAGMAVLPLWVLSGPAGRGVGLIAHLGAAGLVESAKLVDHAPWLALRVPPPNWFAIGAYYLGWIVWIYASAAGPPGAAIQRSLVLVRRVSVAVVALSGLWILVSPARFARAAGGGQLVVTFLDVGQADGVLVQFPDGRSLLVDAGGQRAPSTFDLGSRVVTPALWAMGVHRLDFLAITHGDPDHIGGAPAALRDFRPREIWEGVPVPSDALLSALRRGADRSGSSWRTLRAGDAMEIGGVAVRVWHPPPPDWERQRVRNDDSLVLELKFGGVSVLLPGDISGDVERVLAPCLAPAAFRLLKVPHHGSASSSTSAFLAAARPDVGVLTAGRGTVISRDVLTRYRNARVALFRTGVDGAVTMTTDGWRVDVRTFAGARRTFQPTPAIPALPPHRP